MPRIRAALATLALTLAALLVGASPAPADPPPDGPVLIEGVDLHDTTIRLVDGTYYMYGSVYGCGYEWYVSGTPWCGFGVSTAPSLGGPWTTPKLLFDPNSQDPWAKRSWQETCGGTGQGCFNPRVIVRSGWGYNDAVPILWFNAPRHYSDTKANAYNVMGCASLVGPCGPGATPNGSYNKPSLSVCAGNGDFGIIERPGVRPAIVCSMPGAAQLNIEELNYSGSGGTGQGVRQVAGMSGPVEGPGGWWDAGRERYVLTYSDQGCGYCAGTPIGYAVSSSLYSGWSAPGNVGWGAPSYGRRIFNGNSCGGQPRTVTVLDGRPYQIIDLWVGARNETQAPTLVTPLDYTPRAGAPGDGKVWVPPVSLSCS
ncbi:hypothetical protein DF268_08400 [Streptomyces sp. V2]|uniref:hypothetical protein n=1 Tax=Streptomyces sp. V2 TaxID=1424099 RepID=UPI000D66F4B9|nr:hypothetical protein [Streptomyces sp. V2]PWG13883.1 hypothetical protein DF268_08400 [Streptomyces sp. V2]